jgi:hypothetical protein
MKMNTNLIPIMSGDQFLLATTKHIYKGSYMGENGFCPAAQNDRLFGNVI